MDRKQVIQYAAAAGLIALYLLQDEQVAGALGLWLSPSLVTLLTAASAAIGRMKDDGEPE